MIAWFESLPSWVAALPWVVAPLVVYVRMRASSYLDAHPPARGPGVPRVSVIVPARDEAPNIERCVRSLLATTYENIEVIVVDDHSRDGTGDIARRAIGDDARARVTTPPPLPAGWFGKQWGCAHGASLATGDVLLFTDADTWHAHDCVGRSVTALEHSGAHLLSLLGTQEVETFWERAGQPPMFLGIFTMIGGTNEVNRSRNPLRKGANGQFLMMRRTDYDELNGHEAVRAHVAEDVMFAQSWTRAGKTVHLLLAYEQLRTRMYRSLGEFYRGWRKNAWAGGVPVFGKHRALHVVFGVIAPTTPFFGLIPHAALVLGLVGVLPSWWIAFGAIGYAYETAVLAAIYSAARFPVAAVFLYPLGCVLVSIVFAAAAIRGTRTEWKGREYRAA